MVGGAIAALGPLSAGILLERFWWGSVFLLTLPLAALALVLPASHSLTGSVPVTRAGMASGTADLQRDLGGAMMQSIFGALLTAGYTSSASSQLAGSQVSANAQGELTKSFAAAAATAERYPQYAQQIIGGAKTAFLKGDQWAYTAGAVAVLIGAALVWFFFPRNDDEQRLLEEYRASDSGR